MAPRSRRIHADPSPQQPLIPPEGTPAVVSGRPVTPIRSTMDLQPEEHAEFLKWAVDASTATGRSIQGQNVLRALVRRLLIDDELQREIIDDLAKGKGAKHA